MPRSVSHYEVRYINSSGRIVNSTWFGADELTEAREVQQRDAYKEPAASGWTIYRSGDGGESETAGLHA